MKKLTVLLMLFITISCLAVNRVEYKGDKTLLDISKESEIPVKKWIQYLEISNETPSSITLNELKLNQKKMDIAFDEYVEHQTSFYAGVVIVGMLIVFASLIITGLIISQLEHFSKKKPKQGKMKTVKTSAGKVTGPVEHLSSNAIVAAITAIYLHELEVEEQNKLLLTWKRAPLSVWKTAKFMPNNSFFMANKR